MHSTTGYVATGIILFTCADLDLPSFPIDFTPQNVSDPAQSNRWVSFKLMRLVSSPAILTTLVIRIWPSLRPMFPIIIQKDHCEYQMVPNRLHRSMCSTRFSSLVIFTRRSVRANEELCISYKGIPVSPDISNIQRMNTLLRRYGLILSDVGRRGGSGRLQAWETIYKDQKVKNGKYGTCLQQERSQVEQVSLVSPPP